MSAAKAAIPDDGFSPDQYQGVGFPRISKLCRSLDARYPGIRFNRVEVNLSALFWMRSHPDEDYVEVMFNLSGTTEALRRHGFYEPVSCPVRQRTPTGFRYTMATYKDGLERIAEVMVLPLLPWRRKVVQEGQR